MNPAAHYVTQQSLWSMQIGKVLTNRRINQLQKLGYYGSGLMQAQFKNEASAKRKSARMECFDKF